MVLKQVHKVKLYSDGRESNFSSKAQTLHLGAIKATKYFELHINREQVAEIFMPLHQAQP
jgi:hypothetical protein